MVERAVLTLLFKADNGLSAGNRLHDYIELIAVSNRIDQPILNFQPEAEACCGSLDNLVADQQRGDSQAEGFSRLQAHNLLETCTLFDWQVAGLCSLQDLIGAARAW